jgi:long-chain acyl-CoA synthetase
MRDDMNLKLVLESAAGRFAGKTAIIMGERRLSFAELEEASNRVANALIKMGIAKGDRVATIQSSNPEFVTIFFGIIKTGGIAVPLDARYVADELTRLFEDCQPKVLVAENPPLDSLVPALPRFNTVKHIITPNSEYGDKFISYRQILEENPATSVDVALAPDDTAIISYTGGPTQKPHGVMLSHRSVCTEAITSGDVFEQTDKDVLIAFALPMYHQFGLTSVLLASIVKGSTVVVVPGTGRSIDSFMEAVEREKGTIYMGVPYIYALMINVARREGIKHDLSSLRLCISGGAPLEPEIIQQFKQYYGFNLLDIWGQTETVSHATVSPIDGSGKIGSSGKPMPCWELKIFDDNDQELPANQEGEMVIRGPIMSGFYHKPEATAAAIRSGWLHTGDIGRIDEDGFLFITGRKRRMLILKGQNVFPDDIEEVLIAHPKIAGAKIIGVPDLIRGETIKALIRLKPGEKTTEQEIRQFCQGRMADYKLPRTIEFMDAIPEITPNWTRPKSWEAPELKIE